MRFVVFLLFEDWKVLGFIWVCSRRAWAGALHSAGTSGRLGYELLLVSATEAARKALGLSHGEEDPRAKKWSGVASAPVASSDIYCADEIYSEASDDRDWDVNDSHFTLRNVNTARVC